MFKKTGFLVLLTLHCTAFAAPTDMQFGAVAISKTSEQTLHHSGMLQLDDVKVADSTLVNGFLAAKHSQFHELTVNGQCALENTELLGPVSVNGQLLLKHVNADAPVTVFGFLGARNAIFTQPVTVKSSNLDFIDSTLQSLTIGDVQGNPTQTLNLTRTKVNGGITFESGNGIVKMDPASNIKGKVTGGTIEKVAAKPEGKK
ncbi:MAG: hypothetical protein AB7I18_14325 [Candidatus Berkiella sp.]